MDNPLADATRDHVEEYIWRLRPKKKGGMTQGKLAKKIGYNRKSLNEFVNGHLPQMPADATENFYKLYNKLDRTTPWTSTRGAGSTSETPSEYGNVDYEAEIIALALEGLIGTLRNPDESDTTKYLETIHVLYGLLKEIAGRVNFESEATTSSESNIV